MKHVRILIIAALAVFGVGSYATVAQGYTQPSKPKVSLNIPWDDQGQQQPGNDDNNPPPSYPQWPYDNDPVELPPAVVEPSVDDWWILNDPEAFGWWVARPWWQKQ